MSDTVIGIDLGGTKIDAARYRCDSWEEEERLHVKTEADKGVDHVLGTLVSVIEKLKADTTTAVGIGVPGPVAHPEGTVLTFPNIPGKKDIPLRKIMTERSGLPCTVDNDANCFTLAEAHYGAGKGSHVVVGVTVGTGVGGGIVIDGKIFRGEHGLAAEVGHMLLVPGHPPFETDDKRGDVEQFISGTALGKRCPQAGSPEDYLSGDTCSFLHDDIVRETAWICASLIHALDPGIIVIGGGAGRALAAFLPKIQKELENWVLPATPLPELKLAELKDAATRGAALLTSERRSAPALLH